MLLGHIYVWAGCREAHPNAPRGLFYPQRTSFSEHVLSMCLNETVPIWKYADIIFSIFPNHIFCVDNISNDGFSSRLQKCALYENTN